MSLPLTALVSIENDPSDIGWSANLPIEIAMGRASVQEICGDYGVSRAEWNVLREHPGFIQALEEAVAMLQQEGAMFRVKLKAQAEGMLTRNWELTHASTEHVSPTVQADLIKFTIRAAGLDASIEQKAKAAGQGVVVNPLQINLILGD